MWKRGCLALTVLLLGCGETVQRASDSEQASQGQPPSAVARGVAVANGEGAPKGIHLAPVPEPSRGQAEASARADHCPEDKKNRPDWAALQRSKADLKAKLPEVLARHPQAVTELRPPPAKVLARQARFLDEVEAHKERLARLPPQEREAAYSALKRSLLEE